MINALWACVMGCAVVTGLMTGQSEAVGSVALTAASQAVELSIGLLGGYALWCGLMRVMQDAGWMNALERVLQKPVGFLFPQATSVRSREAIIANLSANMLGIGNAATPAGLAAIREMAKCEKRKGAANDAMCMLLIINASSIQLIPSTVIALRQSAGSADPAGIIPAALAATTVSTVVGIAAARGFARVWR